MKTLLLLLLFSAAFARYFPGHWKAKGRGKWLEKLRTTKPLSPRYDDEDSDIPRARSRWCVSSKCELRKCMRMTMELNYKTVPKMQWSCVMASNIMECMKYVEKGYADIMSIPGKKIYKAGKYHDLVPILMEKYDTNLVKKYQKRFASYEKNGFMKHYSVALVKKTSSIRRFADLKDKKSCHYDIATHASFKNPICSLIHKKEIPVKGNLYESAAAYFEKSCAPGAKVEGSWWNRNGTMPDSLCSLCKGTDKNFCEMKKGEPLYGYKGALKCLEDDVGHVGFFHTYDVMKDYDKLRSNYSLVCSGQRQNLKWEHIEKKECHLNVEYPNVVVVHESKSSQWKTKCSQVLQNAVKQFKPTKNKDKNDFNLFTSDPYCPTTDEDNLYKKTNLIFNDHTSNFLPIAKRTTYKTFLDGDVIKMWDYCKSLRPKPRAFICVVGNKERAKCRKMKEYFAQKLVTDTVSWGCVEAVDRYECMEKVKRGEADIVSLNATEMFIAGRDFNLSPFIGENYNNKLPLTKSITVGVLRKDNRKSTEKLHEFKMCFRGDQTLTSYHHPIGWLISNGTIPRPRDRTLTRFFTEGCWPGIDKLDFTKDYISRHLLDWYEFVTERDVNWTTWYQNPDWRKREQKLEYNRWHKIHDFKSDKFNYLKMKMYMENTWIHRMHTKKWHDMIKKADTTFDWANYNFQDFYDFFPKFKFFLKLYEKPQFKTEQEWDAFMDWVGPQWDSEVDCAEHNKWTAKDWTDFKRWMDYEYADYIQKDKRKPLHKDTFIRFYIYSNRFDWLKTEWKKLQWTLPKYKEFRQQFCKTCTGPSGNECSMDPQHEITSNHKDILHCVHNKAGELGFLDAYTLESAILKHGFRKSDFVLLCPDGTRVDYTGPQSFKECNFGRVPSRALVTCNKKHDGVWRWAVTKAFLEAQKIFKGSRSNEWNFNLFEEDSIFSENIKQLSPIDLTDQTYQHWLGPKLLRSLEGLFYNTPCKTKSKSDIETLDDYDDVDDDDDDDDDDVDYGYYDNDDDDDDDYDDDDDDDDDDDYDDDDDDYDDDDDDDYDDGDKDSIKKPRRTRRGTKPWYKKHLWKMGRYAKLMKSKFQGLWRRHSQHPMGHKFKHPVGHKLKHPMGHKFSHPMGHKFSHPMGHKFSHPMGYKLNYPMGHKLKRPMGHTFMGRPHKFMSRYPYMSRHTMRPRGQLYSTVIKTRNDTCSAITKEIACYGKKKIAQQWVGRISKTLISVPLCPKPSVYVKRYLEFTCNTGAGYTSPVMTATKCSYLPCTKQFWVPGWSLDSYWKGENLYNGEKHWGTEAWWNPDNHVTNENWFPEHRRAKPLKKQRKFGQRWRSQ